MCVYIHNVYTIEMWILKVKMVGMEIVHCLVYEIQYILHLKAESKKLLHNVLSIFIVSRLICYQILVNFFYYIMCSYYIDSFYEPLSYFMSSRILDTFLCITILYSILWHLSSFHHQRQHIISCIPFIVTYVWCDLRNINFKTGTVLLF